MPRKGPGPDGAGREQVRLSQTACENCRRGDIWRRKNDIETVPDRLNLIQLTLPERLTNGSLDTANRW